MTQEKLEALLADMSLEEKVGQMVQVTSAILGGNTIVTGPDGNYSYTKEQLALVGSFLGSGDPEQIAKIQNDIMASQPHHIPALAMLDVINGFQTIFPIPLAQACSFRPELAEAGARIAAKEASKSGVHLTFAPMCDLARDARWGRVMESFGEDPVLDARFAEASVRGFQGKPEDQDTMAACLKHFAAYGYPEGGRDYDNVELSERTFRGEFLSGYKAAVDAGVKMAMTSFNTINRIPATANKTLMRTILRKEMGFDGVLISDYDAVGELVPQGVAEDAREAAKLAIEAGVDIDMVSPCYVNHLADLVRDGEVEEKWIDEAVMRILKLKNDLGLFEDPLRFAAPEELASVLKNPEFRAQAREAAAESFILIKNEGVLPLNGNIKTLLLTGPYAQSRELTGAWSFPTTKEDIPTIEEALHKILPETVTLDVVPGTSLVEKGTVLKDEPMPGMTAEQIDAEIRTAASRAVNADHVVVCLGEYFLESGEGSAKTKLTLSEPQMRLLRAVHAVNNHVTAIVFSGRPIELAEIEELAEAVLLVWMPGTEGGSAIAEVLTGVREPGGRLSMSIPFSSAQEPLYYSRFQGGRPRRKSSDRKGFALGYINQDYWPLHSFGYGLGYTKMHFGPVTLSESRSDSLCTASCTITNTGSRTGKAVAQLYIRDITASIVRPMRELKDFSAFTLEAGESRTVTFSVTQDMLSFLRADGTFGTEPGKFVIYIGSDSTTENGAEFLLK